MELHDQGMNWKMKSEHRKWLICDSDANELHVNGRAKALVTTLARIRSSTCGNTWTDIKML